MKRAKAICRKGFCPPVLLQPLKSGPERSHEKLIVGNGPTPQTQEETTLKDAHSL